MARNTSKSVSSNKSVSSKKSAKPTAVCTGEVGRFEELEQRRLFSTLLINGTTGGDNIYVSQTGTQLTVNLNGTTHSYTAAYYTDIQINGLTGNDNISANGVITKKIVEYGGDGNDSLNGAAGGDVLYGGNGDDYLKANGGADTYWGGTGTDTVDYSMRSSNITVIVDDVANDGAAGEADNVHWDMENIFTGSGNDFVQGNANNNYIRGNAGNDTLSGRSGNDTIFGGAGDDVVDGGFYGQTDPYAAGTDYLYGEAGNDSVRASEYSQAFVSLGDGNDYFVGGAGSDTVYAGAGDDAVYTYAGNDYLYGDSGNDYLWGGDGNDYFSGGSGTSTLVGGNGNDSLYGSYGTAGYSYLYGDAGDDIIQPAGGLTVAYGGDGNDDINSFSSNTTWEHGGEGNDTLYGGYGQNVLYGEGGNDTVKGYGTQWNWLYGGDGNDIVKGSKSGGAVWNWISGDAGNDSVFGGQGNDNINGGDGDDVLVSIGGGTADSVQGGNGFDSFWADAESTEKTGYNDTFGDVFIEALAGNGHRVAGFWGGVSRELVGQNLTDPSDSGSTADFRSHTLFGSGGPNKNDIAQGNVGDCWLMATFSAVAKTDPWRVQQSVVDLGDGTYAVQMRNGSANTFVRVDGDLPVWTGTSSLRYAQTGHDGNIWAPIMEKAWAFYRTGASTYGSLNGGWMDQPFTAFGGTGNNFRGPGTSSTDLLNYIADELNAGKAVTVGTGTVEAGCPCIGGHAYMVERVNYSSFTWGGTTFTYASSVTLRNPWGVDGAGNDGNNDAYVTVTGTQLMNSIQGVQSASV